MCGIAGIFAPGSAEFSGSWEQVLAAMGNAIAHRGPDASGNWHDASMGIGLAHRRLSIIDLSELGAQPMHSQSGRFVLSYNGEIYNFPTLKDELISHGKSFRGGSDTEVLLAAIETWGIAGALERACGMFAIALWDRSEQRLTLARDRLGKKPVYIARHGNALLFGSELKALRACPGFNPGINRTALQLFLRYSYIPGPFSIYEDTAQLPPGCWLELSIDDLATPGIDGILKKVQSYWSLESVADQPRQSELANLNVAADYIKEALSESVSERMVSDVPLGAFLSGGIDSSLVVAMMAEQANTPVRTFTIGFRDKNFDEAAQSRNVANFLGTDHTELYVTPEDILSVIENLPCIYDEPFADPSQIPTFVVSNLASEHITVAMTGDGGDESFGGYEKYLKGVAAEPLLRLPLSMRRLVGKSLNAVPESLWDRCLSPLRWAGLSSATGHRTRAIGDILQLQDLAAIQEREAIRWDPQPLAGCHPAEEDVGSTPRFSRMLNASQVERMMYADSIMYLPDDILVKVDRASMASSLELRAPLLDHRVIERAWRLPIETKIGGGSGKLVLRRLLSRYLPTELFDRPKQGFGVPVSDWLRGPLRDWAETLLDASRIEQEGYLEAAPIRAAWEAHLSGTADNGFRLWTVLMWQAWHERWQTGQPQ